jgi:hypothetical protein
MFLYSLVTADAPGAAPGVTATGSLLTLSVDGCSFRLVKQEAQDLLQVLIDHLPELPDQVARRAESYELAGLPSADAPHPYTAATRTIDHLIGRLKGIRADIQSLARHRHAWALETDYCIHCGADGRA